ncbi:MAG: chemotaxis response regulator protein-glutamate methylesterase [Gammaproteobacteria bacterium]|nr:chemotaxis response regulator protein-glutamate methylesterase [Gammaproteobacteria bacterium]
MARVVIVDDSSFFRNRLRDMLLEDGHIDVIGMAKDGREAVAMVNDLHPDVVTMDVEMPVMNGIAAVKEIMSHTPTPVLMLSSMTTEGAGATLDSLAAGAVDFIAKPDGVNLDINFKRKLCARVRLIAARGASSLVVPTIKEANSIHDNHDSLIRVVADADLIFIGASTGGPIAVQQLLQTASSKISCPIIVVQHMPSAFTEPYAERLNGMSNLEVRHLEDAAILTKGVIYISPGGKQLGFVSRNGELVTTLKDGVASDTYKPCIDYSLKSLAEGVNNKSLVIIMTGMGSDGKEGVARMKKRGATIWAQDEKSCVIYGMPQAVVEAGLADAVLSLSQMKSIFSRIT